MFVFDEQNMRFSESKLAFYIFTCPAVYLELLTWDFLSRISFLALFVLTRFFFEDALAIVMDRAEK